MPTPAPTFPAPAPFGVNASALPRSTPASRRKTQFVARVVRVYGESYRSAAVAYARREELLGRLPRTDAEIG